MVEQRASILEECLKDCRKYVVASDPNDRQVVIMNLEDKLTTSLMEIAGLEESTAR
jgi:hypothetical protein